MADAADAPAGLVRRDHGRVADLLAQLRVGRRGGAGRPVQHVGEAARRDLQAERGPQQVGNLRQRHPHLRVQLDDQRDDRGTELHARRAQRVGGLQHVVALHPPLTLRAVGGSRGGHTPNRPAVRDAPPRPCGRSLAKRRGLPATRPACLVQLPLQALDLLLQALILPLQALVPALLPLGVALAPRQLPLSRSTSGSRFSTRFSSALRSAVVTPTLCHKPEICTTVNTLTDLPGVGAAGAPSGP